MDDFRVVLIQEQKRRGPSRPPFYALRRRSATSYAPASLPRQALIGLEWNLYWGVIKGVHSIPSVPSVPSDRESKVCEPLTRPRPSGHQKYFEQAFDKIVWCQTD